VGGGEMGASINCLFTIETSRKEKLA